MPDIGADEYNPPEKQADDIIEFIESGAIVGVGPAKPAGNKINALRNMIETAKQMIEEDDIAAACKQLQSAYEKTDGVTPAPDWVEAGKAAEDLANMIQELMNSIGCS